MTLTDFGFFDLDRHHTKLRASICFETPGTLGARNLGSRIPLTGSDGGLLPETVSSSQSHCLYVSITFTHSSHTHNAFMGGCIAYSYMLPVRII